jgi:methylated-DNA-protein-cysteine methyltransferase-like protein
LLAFCTEGSEEAPVAAQAIGAALIGIDKPATMGTPSSYERIYAQVARVPSGNVATYGQIADLADLPGHARQVGYALHALPAGCELPWHRVINAKGEVSQRAEIGWEGFQRQLLEEEGVVFDSVGRVDLKRYRWEPPLTAKLGQEK